MFHRSAKKSAERSIDSNPLTWSHLILNDPNRKIRYDLFDPVLLNDGLLVIGCEITKNGKTRYCPSVFDLDNNVFLADLDVEDPDFKPQNIKPKIFSLTNSNHFVMVYYGSKYVIKIFNEQTFKCENTLSFSISDTQLRNIHLRSLIKWNNHVIFHADFNSYPPKSVLLSQNCFAKKLKTSLRSHLKDHFYSHASGHWPNSLHSIEAKDAIHTAIAVYQNKIAMHNKFNKPYEIELKDCNPNVTPSPKGNELAVFYNSSDHFHLIILTQSKGLFSQQFAHQMKTVNFPGKGKKLYELYWQEDGSLLGLVFSTKSNKFELKRVELQIANDNKINFKQFTLVRFDERPQLLNFKNKIVFFDSSYCKYKIYYHQPTLNHLTKVIAETSSMPIVTSDLVAQYAYSLKLFSPSKENLGQQLISHEEYKKKSKAQNQNPFKK